ncbi:hypothetical protein [Microbacterium sp.]|uniref:hypothetical protein n=1 Tax=Microbacterium sp. TaxID=51671 RepID=UPI0032423A86
MTVPTGFVHWPLVGGPGVVVEGEARLTLAVARAEEFTPPASAISRQIVVRLADGSMPATELMVGRWEIALSLVGASRPRFYFDVTPQHTAAEPLSLALVAPITPSATERLVVNEQLRRDALEAAQAAGLSAEQARASVDNAGTQAARAEAAASLAVDASDIAASKAGIAESARLGAVNARSGAEAAQTAAIGARDTAAQSAIDAEAQHAAVSAIRGEVDAAKGAALDARDAAAASASDALTARSQAQAAKAEAETAASGAELAKAVAVTMKAGAEAALSAAIGARADAETARDVSQTARAAAETARSGAENAQDAAQTARTGAESARNETIVAVNNSPAEWTGAVTLTANFTRSAYVRRRLTGNVTLTVSPGDTGRAYSCTLELTQDGTGGRSILFANVATPYGIAIPLSSAANAVDIVRLEWNGSRWAAFLGGAQLVIPTSWIV